MASYDVQTPDGAQYTIEAESDDQLNSAVNDLTPSKSIGGLAENAIANAKELGSSAYGLGKKLLTEPTGEIPGTVENVVKGIPKSLVEEGKRLGGGELLTGHPIDALKKFGNAAYEKPITTGLDIAPILGAGSKALGALRGGAEAADIAAPAIEAAAKEAPAAEAATSAVGKIANEVKAAPVAPVATAEPAVGLAPEGSVKPPMPPPITEQLAGKAVGAGRDLLSQIPDNVKDFVSRTKTKLPDTPISNSTIGKYAMESARQREFRALGGTPKMAKTLGEKEVNSMMDAARENGYVDLKTGHIGAKEKILADQNSTGEMVGSMRELAASRGAVHDMPTLLQRITDKLSNKYDLAEDAAKGTRSSGAGAVRKALVDIQKTPPTPDAMAKTVTDLFHQAKNENLAQNIRSLKRPEGPLADVAHELRAANEELLTKTLSPKELNAYHHALEKYGLTTQLGELSKMKWARDTGRLGPGFGIVRGAFQKGMDVIGNKGIAHVQRNIAKWLQENPSATTTPKELFRHYVDESVDAMDEMGEGLK